MDYQKFILVGNASTDAKIQKSKKGDVSFATFGVGVKSGKDRTHLSFQWWYLAN